MGTGRDERERERDIYRLTNIFGELSSMGEVGMLPLDMMK